MRFSKDQIISTLENHKKNKCISTEVVEGKYYKLENKKFVIFNGKEINRESLVKRASEAVVVLSITVDGNFLMVIQPRPVLKEGATIEFPSGLVEGRESVINAARRELLEETGYSSEDIKVLRIYHIDSAISDFNVNLCLALNCKKESDQNLDDEEYITFFEGEPEIVFLLEKEGYINGLNTMYGLKILEDYIKKT